VIGIASHTNSDGNAGLGKNIKRGTSDEPRAEHQYPNSIVNKFPTRRGM